MLRRTWRPLADPQTDGSGAPPAGAMATPAAQEGAAVVAPTGGAASGEASSLTLEQAQKVIADLRRESAGYRTKAKELDDLRAQQEQASLSETQKAAKRAEAAEASAKTLQAHVARLTVEGLAARMGYANPTLAATVVTAHLEYGADGLPTNAEAELKTLLEANPYLAGSATPGASSSPVAHPTSGSATNPPRSSQAGLHFTSAQIRAMSPTEYKQNQAAILEAMRAGNVR